MYGVESSSRPDRLAAGGARTPGQSIVMQWTIYLACALLALILVPPAHGQSSRSEQNVAATIETETILPAPGDKVTIAIIMKPRPGWHDYWLNPADAGTPLELDWKLPPGVTAGPVRAPVPETLIVSGFMNHIYRTEHAFLVDLNIADSVRVGQTLPVSVAAMWSACSDTVCIPEQAELSLVLKVGTGEIDKASRNRFDMWRSALPVPLDQQGRYAIKGKKIEIAIPYPKGAAVSDIWFFAQTENLFSYATEQKARRTDDWLVVTAGVETDFDGPIDGLLRFGEAQGLEIRAIPGVVPSGGETVSILGSSGARRDDETPIGFGLVLGFAIFGGLILNLMPCVFPILGLKALTLAKSGGAEIDARRDALAYAAGAILSCVALGAMLLALRAGGEQVGWAFQLQEPAIVLLLFLLMVAVTANLAGLFEIAIIDVGNHLPRKSGLAGSFWTGVLAAVVATPCTGPFMAAALGAALLLPAPQALLLFAGLGLGLALPFLSIAYVPRLRGMLPRPGPWLDTFRKAMAVPMALTALALLWLLWRLSGLTGLAIGLGAASVVAVALWRWGRGQRQGKSGRRAIASLLAIALAATLVLPGDTGSPGQAKELDFLSSQPFSEAALLKARQEGKSVFVYFTADWCLTCKVNEAAAIDRMETRAAFGRAGIVTLKGDFTRRDPAISRFLEQHGRSGVPLYLFYPRGGSVRVLPQILTVDTLTALVD